MNIIQSMIHEKLGEVRIIKSEDGNPMHTLFCAVDVVKSLGYPENSYRSTISRHCSAVRKTHATDSIGREQIINFIPLSDVFRLIDRSNKPEAVEFQDWLYEEVLPSLYQYGNYNMDNHINNPEFTNPMFDPQNVGIEANDYNKYDLTTTSSDSLGNVLEIDNRPMVYNMGIMLNQYMEPLFNKISQLESQLNIITNNTEEIKQMIIPAIIVNK